MFKSTTKFLFIATLIFSLFWVSASYCIGIYAVVKLGEVDLLIELSKQVVTTVIGVVALKSVENIFEHNDGAVFGTSNNTEK